MANAERELLKSYYHARKTAVGAPIMVHDEEEFYREYEDYEIIEYALENNYILTERIKTNQVYDIAKETPEVLKYVPEKIKELDEDNIFGILLENNPEDVMDIISKNWDIKKLEDSSITMLIENNPKYFDYLEPLLKNVKYGWASLVMKHPELFEKIKPYVKNFRDIDIPLILAMQPQLIDKYDWGLETLDYTALNDPEDEWQLGQDAFTALLERQPQLAAQYHWSLNGLDYAHRQKLFDKQPELKKFMVD